MVKRILTAVAALLLAGCGGASELVSQTKTVAAPREQVFAQMFGDGSGFSELPLVTNGGSTRLYELVIEKGDPLWAKIAPEQRPDAYKVKLAVAMEIPREAHMIYSIDDGALTAGFKFTFEELAPERTRVAFTIDELGGRETEGLALDSATLRTIAHRALFALDSFDAAPTAP